MRRCVPVLFSLALACEAPAEDGDASMPASDASTTQDPSSSSGETTGEPEAESTGPETTDDVRLDLPPPQEMTCQKIDFLFVIDNSGSMSDEQARLIDGFPGFIADIEQAIQQYDYHMMVVTTDGSGNDPDDCETAPGAGRVAAADGTDCGLMEPESMMRFADAEDDELASVFECVAEVGVEGSGHEMPIWSMAQAVTTQSSPGGCNEGFLRDDAILVVTIITDEEDDAMFDSLGDPPLWREVMISAKHGDEKAIVMLGLIGDTDLDDGVCQPFDEDGQGADAAPRIREFVESFSHGSWASVCLPAYAPFFNDAIADIGEACTEFVPPG